MRLICMLLVIMLTLAFQPPVFADGEPVGADDGRTEKNASLKILTELYEGQNMLVFSPISLSVALAMAEDGAAGETAAQLSRFLGGKQPDPFILEDLAFSGVHLASAALVSPDLTLLPDYQSDLNDAYGAEVIVMNDGSVCEQVNEWVHERTDGMIDSLLQEEPDPEAQLILMNALQMKADWAHPFNPEKTLPSVFHAPDGEIEVSSMNQTGIFAYGEKDGIQSVLLPYADSFLEMLILLPADGSLDDLLNDLCASPDEFILAHLPTEKASVHISLPNVRAESCFEMSAPLSIMGVTDAFDMDHADFSNMTEEAKAARLHIGSVIQKSVLTVNESGTEAGSAAQVRLSPASDGSSSIAVMNVDRPFMMLIYDPMSGYVLFAACINNPA